MSICAHHAQLLDQWAALGGVPQDRATRDFACELLLEVWADRQMWVGLAMELTELHGPLVPQDASTAAQGGVQPTPRLALSGVPGALADQDAPRPAVPNSGVQGTHHPENADSRTPRQSGSAVRTHGA